MSSADRNEETTDRLMVGVCGAIWLVLLVVSVIALVALVNLGRGHSAAGTEDSPWLLYTVIAVSSVVIVGAIPLLLKARRTAMDSRDGGAASPSPGRATAPAATRREEAPTEKMRVFGTAVDPYAKREPAHRRVDSPAAQFVDRLWLRGTTSLLSAMGLALIAVATATYLLAADADLGAWIALGVAGAITAAMPAVLVVFQRRLAEVGPVGG